MILYSHLYYILFVADMMLLREALDIVKLGNQCQEATLILA